MIQHHSRNMNPAGLMMRDINASIVPFLYDYMTSSSEGSWNTMMNSFIQLLYRMEKKKKSSGSTDIKKKPTGIEERETR